MELAENPAGVVSIILQILNLGQGHGCDLNFVIGNTKDDINLSVDKSSTRFTAFACSNLGT